MSVNRALAVHNFRWKRPDGRVSWTYRNRIAALSVERSMPEGSVLESSPDNGATWVQEPADPSSEAPEAGDRLKWDHPRAAGPHGEPASGHDNDQDHNEQEQR